MKKLYFYNTIIKIIFLLITPTIFRALGFAFIWHSIYWGVITWTVLIWGFLIIITPLFGRIGCGWICFFGTLQDLAGQQSLFKIRWSKPKNWIRILMIVGFFVSAFSFYFIHIKIGMIKQIQFNLGFLNMDFTNHYKQVWIYDTIGAVLFGVLFDKRWICRNLCFMGALCSAGASYSRLIPVVDTKKCNNCGKCDKECLVKIPIKDYIANNNGLMINSECIICGKCVDICNQKAISIRFIWNRKKFINKNVC